MKKMTIATVALVAALSAFPRDVSIVVDVAAKPIASVDYSAAGAKLGAGPAMAKQDDFHALVARTKRAFAAFDRGKTDVSPFNGKTDRIWTRYLSLALRDHRKALEYHKKALAICEKAHPPEHPDLAASYNNIGDTYYDLGDHRKALEYHKKAVAIYEKSLPP